MFDMAIQPERSGPIVAYARAPDNAGKSRRQLARELGVHESLVRRSLATMTTEEESMPKPREEVLPVRSIVLDPGIQPRAASDDRAIGDYQKAYEKGGDLGLVVVFRDPDEGIVRVADGFHRLTAAGLAGLETIRCEVRIGNRSACIAHALTANLRHTAIRYTRADKRRAVGIALADPELSKRSDRELAVLCGVSDKSVGKFRKESTAEFRSSDEHEKRVGKDGKARSMPTRQPEPTPAEPLQVATDVPGDEAEDDLSQLDGKGDAFEGPADVGEAGTGPPHVAEPTAGPVAVDRSGGSAPPTAEHREPTEDELSDEEWLATLPARAKLAAYPRRRFDNDALFFREFQPFIKTIRNTSASLRKKYRQGGRRESYQFSVENLLGSRHPKHWLACKVCSGTSKVPLIGDCAKCHGRGYFSVYVPMDQDQED